MGLLQDLAAKAAGKAGGRGGYAAAGLPGDVTSHAMREAVARWYRLYYDDVPRPGYDPGGRLAYAVVTRLVRTVFSEYSHSISGAGAKAEGLRGALAALDEVREEALMHCLIGGECLVKPCLLYEGGGAHGCPGGANGADGAGVAQGYGVYGGATGGKGLGKGSAGLAGTDGRSGTDGVPPGVGAGKRDAGGGAHGGAVAAGPAPGTGGTGFAGAQGLGKGGDTGGEAGAGRVAGAPGGARFGFVVIRRTAYRVLGRDELGRATGYATVEVSEQDGAVFTLLEERRVLPGGRVRIQSRLYKKRRDTAGPLSAGRFMDWGAPGGASAVGAAGVLGARVPLASLEKYAALEEDVVLPVPLHSTGLIELKMPVANCVDGSADGVSVYAAAAGAIEAAARLEAELGEEFRRAKSRIVASRDMLREGKDGKKLLEDDLFIALDDDPANVGLTIFSPAIREASFLRRKNDYLRTVENIIGLNRGILCEADSVRRTATEISASEGEYNLTVGQIQNAWRLCVERLVDCCDRLGRMYLGWDAAAHAAPRVDFGDGVLFNRQQAWQEYERMVQNGWLKPEVALAWYFGIDDEDEEAVRKMMPGHFSAEAEKL